MNNWNIRRRRWAEYRKEQAQRQADRRRDAAMDAAFKLAEETGCTLMDALHRIESSSELSAQVERNRRQSLTSGDADGYAD